MSSLEVDLVQGAWKDLLRATAGVTGEAFFRALAQSVAQVLGTRHGFVGILMPERPGWVRSLAYWTGEEFAGPLEYALEGTPCAEVTQGVPCLINEGVAQRYPQDPLLQDGFECYFGTPLTSFSGEIRGLLVGLDRRPHVPPPVAATFLDLYGVRAVAELERLDAERRLKERNAELEAVINALPDQVFWADASGAIRRYHAALGAESPRVSSPSHLRDLLPTPICESLLLALNDALRRAGEGRLEFNVGDQHYEARLRALSPELVLCALRNDTARHRTELALRESESRYRHIVTSCVEGIWIIDERERTTYVNEQMARMLGYQAEEMIGRSLWDFMNEGGQQLARRNIDRRRRGIAEHHEFRLTRKDGSDCWTIMATNPITNDEGVYVGASAFVTDVTERRGLELKIQHAQKLESLGVLAGGIAHDFNNLLVGILGNVAIARLELPTESPARPAMDDVQTAALRAAELTKQMLAYSGKGRFVIEHLSLNRLVEEMAHLLQTVISKKAILKFSFLSDLPSIEGDATQLRQVVMNLITNASDALADGNGVIALSTGVLEADRSYLGETYLDDDLPDGRYVFLEVSDTGAGMDPQTKQKIFDPFFTTKFTGRGLGLAAVLGILRGHGGAVKVYSEPGKGSSFKVLLPSTTKSEPPAVRTGPSTTTEGKATGLILVVDDEESVRAVARRVLERAGFRVATAAHGRDAVEQFQKDPASFSCVLLDMTMPTMNGDECFRELRRIRADVAVVLSSGYNEQDTTTRFAGKGLAGFIQKPWMPSDLVEVIRGALSRPLESSEG